LIERTDPMNDHVETLFHQASDLPPDERRALLDAACQGDPGLRAEVERLLAEDSRLRAEEGAGAFLDSPLVRSPDAGGVQEEEGGRGPEGPWPAGTPGPSGRQPPAPLRIAHYRIVRLLGEGGMGAVYEAEQDSPRRAVALKVVRPGLASSALLKRFAREAQILGRLHHPGIAQVHEAGLADDGQPFFAMEFIRGLPLNEYANRHGLDLAARVGLVARVCDAVQHAHDEGVIHRDLKPANILVEETGQPKVLDFGAARATDADLLTAAGLTRTGQLLGTPNYMSPEQVSGDPATIDRRADVYALGVILFELAAYRLPHRLEDRPLAEAARLILEQDAPRLGSLNPELRGDVETIVATALAKEPARRYASAADLGADLRRWLAHEPILARPPSALYHLRKFARRHRSLVGGVVATGVALVLGLIGTIFFAVGEARQRGEAEQNAKVANDEKREALFQAYRARLSAAAAALQNHDVVDAARHLADAPPGLRGWEWRHLQSRLDDSTLVLPLPAGRTATLISGAERLRVGIASSDGLRLTDLYGDEHAKVPIPVRNPYVEAVAETRLGLRVVVYAEGAVEVFDEAGRRVCRAENPGVSSPLVAVSRDGTRLAWPRAVDGRWRLTLCDATSGKQKAVCEGHSGHIWSFAFSPDGTQLASSGEDRSARLWDSASGALLATCRGHAGRVLCVSFSPDGTRLLTASGDGVRQWDVATGREVEPPYDRHSGEVMAAAYSPDGLWVASTGSDRTVRVWQAIGRQDVAVLHGHTGNVTGVAFAPDGRRLVSLSNASMLSIAGDDTVRVWEVDSQATLPVLRGHTSYVYPVVFSPDGRWIASGDWDNKIRLWDARTGEACAGPLENGDFVKTLAFSPDGCRLVSARQDWLQVWDVATGRRLKESQVPVPNILALEFRPDGATLAALDGSGGVTVFDDKTGAVVARLRLGASHDTKALAYSPDGRWLAGAGADLTTVCLFDAHTYEPSAQLPGHEGVIRALAFSPDSRRLASCSSDHTVRLWQIDSGDCRVLRGHTDEVFAVAFHPDSSRLASAGRDRAVWLWDLARGMEVARLQGHTNYVWSLAFSPDGATLVSGSGDRTVRLWDTAPLKTRYQARREAEALGPEAERLVEALWRQKHDPAGVVAALRADRALSGPLREAALRAVLRRAQPPAATPGNLYRDHSHPAQASARVAKGRRSEGLRRRPERSSTTPRLNPSARATSTVHQPRGSIRSTERHASGWLRRRPQDAAGSSKKAVRRMRAATCRK
jgi:WD40 repeat protein/predicted Ser/Thr protein kinase